MNKRFIILINDSDATRDEKFMEYINQQKLSWWHHLNNSWLIKTSRDISAQDMRDKVKEIYDEHCFIVELREDGSDTWSGFGPKGESRNMFNWIHKNWMKN